jgi:hypothetical protein
MSGPAPVSWARGPTLSNSFIWPEPDPLPGTYKQLTQRELLTLSTKLRTGKRRALQAAMRSRSMPEIWEMIRLTNDLTELGEDINRALARR